MYGHCISNSAIAKKKWNFQMHKRLKIYQLVVKLNIICLMLSYLNHIHLNEAFPTYFLERI